MMNSCLAELSGIFGFEEIFTMEKLLEILSEIRPEVDYANETDLVNRHLLDSLDIVVLVSDIEEAYGIVIDVNDIAPENFSSLEAMLKLIERRGGKI
ncbi:MAG: acyl carrier protein [Syntrophomonadaceae bacterium]